MTANPYDRRVKMVRLSLSIPSDLLAWVRLEAKRYDVPVSWVVARAIEARRDAEPKPCRDCGHPVAHHLGEHGCYCGCMALAETEPKP